MSQSANIDLTLHPKQGDALQSTATEVLYGGAAGGGKSHLMRVVAIIWCAAIGGLQVYIFRRIRDDLVKNHIEGPKGFRAMLAPWVNAGLCTILEEEIRFWNGSKIYLCHCKDEKDRYKYLGAEIHVLLIDELTTFTDVIYRFLRGRVRAVGLNLPDEYRGLFPRILCSSNPGGVGHHWVKEAFQPHQPGLHMQNRQMGDGEGGMIRQYIPAKLSDNPSMAVDDPNYRSRLRGLGAPALVKAYEDGDWNIVVGAFFTEFTSQHHVIEPFTIPKHWTRFRAADWGSAKPFAVAWFAVSDGEFADIPRGALVMYREWYGVATDQDGGFRANVGLKLTAEDFGQGIVDRDNDETFAYSVLDPAAFAEDGGPSIAERARTLGKPPPYRGPVFRRADNRRVAKRGAMGGWDLVRQRLKGEDDRPMIYFFSTCTHAIRTLPALPHDPVRVEDIDTNTEDHMPDAIRYGCASRPWVRQAPAEDDGMRKVTPDMWKKLQKESGRRSL